jgi:hypothetical protein
MPGVSPEIIPRKKPMKMEIISRVIEMSIGCLKTCIEQKYCDIILYKVLLRSKSLPASYVSMLSRSNANCTRNIQQK